MFIVNFCDWYSNRICSIVVTFAVRVLPYSWINDQLCLNRYSVKKQNKNYIIQPVTPQLPRAYCGIPGRIRDDWGDTIVLLTRESVVDFRVAARSRPPGWRGCQPHAIPPPHQLKPMQSRRFHIATSAPHVGTIRQYFLVSGNQTSTPHDNWWLHWGRVSLYWALKGKRRGEYKRVFYLGWDSGKVLVSKSHGQVGINQPDFNW